MIQTVCRGSNPWISGYHFWCLRQAPTARIKAFRSLQAYNQPVSGFLSCVEGRKIGNNYIVLGKVRHSQRINDPCVTLQIITEENGSALFAHWVQRIGCMAGQCKESAARISPAFSSTLKHGIVWTKCYHLHRWNVVGWCQRPSKTRPFQILILYRQRN